MRGARAAHAAPPPPPPQTHTHARAQETHVETAKRLLGGGKELNDFVARLLDDIANLKAMLQAISIGKGTRGGGGGGGGTTGGAAGGGRLASSRPPPPRLGACAVAPLAPTLHTHTHIHTRSWHGHRCVRRVCCGARRAVVRAAHRRARAPDGRRLQGEPQRGGSGGLRAPRDCLCTRCLAPRLGGPLTHTHTHTPALHVPSVHGHARGAGGDPHRRQRVGGRAV